MEQISIQGSIRENTGKGFNRRLRQAGKIPAVLYGNQMDTVSLEVDPKDIFKILKSHTGENTIFALSIPGRETVNCLIKEYQLEPISHQLLHADFFQIRMDELIEVDIPLVARGEAYGVKTEGGLLDVVHRELKVECLPGDIPDHIEVDVTHLKIGDQLRVKDIPANEKIRILEDPEAVIITVEHPRVEELPAAAAPVAEAEAEPEVIRKGKVVEEEEEEEK